MAKHIKRGLLPPDDPIYSSGLIVGGMRLKFSKKNSGMEKAIEQVTKEANQALSGNNDSKVIPMDASMNLIGLMTEKNNPEKGSL